MWVAEGVRLGRRCIIIIIIILVAERSLSAVLALTIITVSPNGAEYELAGVCAGHARGINDTL